MIICHVSCQDNGGFLGARVGANISRHVLTVNETGSPPLRDVCPAAGTRFHVKTM